MNKAQLKEVVHLDVAFASIDEAKAEISQSWRWLIMRTLNNARPIGAYEGLVLAIIQTGYPNATALEVRHELDYLADRALVELRKEPSGCWFAHITRDGTDVIEYTVDCNPGIAWPAEYRRVDNVKKSSELNAI